MVEREGGIEGKMDHTTAPFSNGREEKLDYPTEPIVEREGGREGKLACPTVPMIGRDGGENWPPRLPFPMVKRFYDCW